MLDLMSFIKLGQYAPYAVFLYGVYGITDLAREQRMPIETAVAGYAVLTLASMLYGFGLVMVAYIRGIDAQRRADYQQNRNELIEIEKELAASNIKNIQVMESNAITLQTLKGTFDTIINSLDLRAELQTLIREGREERESRRKADSGV